MYKLFFKPLFDICLAAIMLFFIWPLLVFISLAIKLTSQGPIFFLQERGGINGSFFTMIKFRSMTVDTVAEKKGFEPGTESRVTTLGKILRKTKLDELPQILNVLKGDMSFIGPRPEVRRYIAIYPKRWSKVHSVKPGISDPASVKFRNEETLLADAKDAEAKYTQELMPQKLDIYDEYVDNISLISDIKIFTATICAVLFR